MEATLIKILSNPKAEWQRIRNRASGSCRVALRELKVDWDIYNAKDYLFTHDSIVASVATEADGYTIKPACEELVNANGNAWTNEVLLNCYKTFIGGENYVEHVQIPSLSRGKILDAVIREVLHNGEKIYVVDILVATNRRNTELVNRIENGQLRTLSMGATAKYVQCSVCGKIVNTVKDDPLCDHLQNHVGEKVMYHGREKMCAELCGAINPRTHEYIPDSCVFIEASWVEQPAFEGAVTNYIIESEAMKVARNDKKALSSMFSASLMPTVRVADKSGKIVMQTMRELLNEDRLDKIARKL